MFIDGSRQISRIEHAAEARHSDGFHAQIFQVRLYNLPVFWMHCGRHDNSLARRHGKCHQHGFGGGRPAVVETHVGNFHTRETGDERLIFKVHLQVALAGLRLIRRV